MRKGLFILLCIVALGVSAWWIFTSSRSENIVNQRAPFDIAALASTAFHLIADTHVPVRGEMEDRINILIMGMPGQNNDGPDMTDTLMLASIKPSTHELALLSIPRDLLVRLPDGKTYTKINALERINGDNPSLLEQKIQEVTGQTVHYYVALDVDAVAQMVDSLGGLNVLVPEDIYDARFPAPGDGTEVFTVQKGWRYFDGATIQKYIRTRHSAGGDFARMRQQQAVIEALRKKIFGLNMLYDFPTLLSLYKAIHYHVQTDIGNDAIRPFYDIAKNISYDKVYYTTADGDPHNPAALLKSATVTLDGTPAFVLQPKAGDWNYTEIRQLAGNMFNN